MKRLLLLTAAAAWALDAAAQAPLKTLTVQDATLNRSLNPQTLPQLNWMGNASRFAWVGRSPKGDALVASSLANPTTKDTLLRPKEIDGKMSRFPFMKWMSESQFWFFADNKVQIFDLGTKKLQVKNTVDSLAENTDIEPNTFRVAYTRRNNVFAVDGGKVKQLSFDTDSQNVNGQAAHRSEFGITKGTFWSPKGNKLAWYRMEQTMVTDYPLVNLGTKPAKAEMIKYPMAGQASHHVTVGVHDFATGNSVFLKTGEPKEQYLTNICFTPDEKQVLVAIVNRAQNEMKLNVYDAQTGNFVRTIFEEKDNEWVEPESPALFHPTMPGLFVWESERTGTNQLYLYDMTGKVTPLTKGNNTVTEVYGWSQDGKHLFYQTATQNGMDRAIQMVDMKGRPTSSSMMAVAGMVINGKINFATKEILCEVSSPQVPYMAHVMKGDKGTLIFQAKNPLEGYGMPRLKWVSLKASEGTPLNARVTLPPNFDSTKKYPVVFYLYGGPHAQMVTNSWLMGANNWFVMMAPKGYIVFTMDNRGSGNRGQAFEEVIHRNLGRIQMEDQMVGVNYLKSLPYVDASRMGIYGWSFGGFMTTTMMTRQPDVFKIGVAGGPVIDWSLYEIMYTERYMDTPQENPEGYKESLLTSRAKDLKGRLMLIHGTIDDVVVWQHSQEFLAACVKAGTLVDYMVYPGHKHNVLGKDRAHLNATITRYFDDHLMK